MNSFSQEKELDNEFELKETPLTFYDSVVIGIEQIHIDIRTEKVTEFTNLWNKGLLEHQQDSVKHLVRAALSKGAKWSGIITQLVDQLYIACLKRKLSTHSLDSLIITDKKVVSTLTRKEVSKFLHKSTSLLETGILHKVGSFEISIGNFKNVDFDALLFVDEEIEELGNDDLFEEDTNTTLEKEEDPWGEENKATQEDDPWDDWDTPNTTEASEDFDPWAEIDEDTVNTDDEWGEEEGSDPLNNELETDELFYGNDIPSVDGIFAKFRDINLILQSKFDSVTIKNVSGTFLYKNNHFIGEKGTFSWNQLSINDSLGSIIKDTIENTFQEFSINLDRPLIEIGNSTINYPSRLQTPIKGLFTYLVRNKTLNNHPYPKFISNTNNAQILGLGKNIEFKGGFKVIANKLYSESIDNSHSFLTFDSEKHKFNLEGKHFELRDSTILSNYASSTIYFKKDSIYHAGSYAKYDSINQSLLLIKNKKEKLKYSPFLDSYHDIEIDVDKLLWNMKDSSEKIIFDNFYARSVRQSAFRSRDFFRARDYIQLKGIYKFHPLQLITSFYYKSKRSRFTTEILSNYYDIKADYIRNNLPNLVSKHLIRYDEIKDEISLTRKGRKWFLAAKKLIDHDQLEIISLSPIAEAAEMNTESGILKVYSVNEFNISDSLKVEFSLKDSTIEIDQNKGLYFSGTVKTSMEQFSGSSFRFDYDSFLVQMDTVDYIALSIEAKENKSEEKRDEEIQQAEKDDDENDPKIDDEVNEDRTLRKSSGTLYLNAPNNKAFQGYLPQYPYFNSSSGAYVFFDGKNIINGAYDKNVYFYIPPFAMDSLSHNGLKEISFDGDFITDNILPDMKESLILMEDRSLGIKNKIPNDGFPVYVDKGIITGDFKMDKQGLRVNGIYNYLNTNALSNDFVLLQDSIITNGNILTVSKGPVPESDNKTIFPQVEVKEYRMTMSKIRDDISVSNLKEPFDIYDGLAKLNGSINISKDGITAKGILETYKTRVFSSSFDFKETKYSSRNTQFQIPSEDPSKPAVSCENVKLTFDFITETAEFQPEILGQAANSFPFLEFETSLYNGKWDIKKNTITFSENSKSDTISPFFRSTREDQDYLTIFAKNGVYYKDSLKLEINGVDKMRISGAEIFPSGKQIIVRENANLDVLQNARIEMDSLHILYDARLKISSRDSFDGNASYDYTNNKGEKFILSFNGFYKIEEKISDSTKLHMLTTTAEISEEDNFFIQKDMQFKGTATLYSKKKNLGFKGYIKPNIKGAVRIEDWMKYSTNGSESIVLISLDNLKNEDDELLSNGIFLSNIEDDLYYKMVSPKETENDRVIFDASGYLNYDGIKGILKIGDKERINESSTKGNLMTYDEKKNILTFDGLFDFAKIEDTNNVQLLTSGHQTLNIRNSKHKVTSLVHLLIEMPEIAYSKMGFALGDIADVKEIRGESEKIKDLYVRAAHLIKDSITAEELSFSGLPLHLSHPQFTKGIVFPDIEMNWSPDYNAWYNKGETVISNIGNSEIDAKFTTYLEIINWPDGDIINLCIETNRGVDTKIWYYFSYKENQNSLTVRSSDETFNGIFYTKKPKLPKKGKMMYILGSDLDKANFIDQFKTNYLGYTLDELIAE